MVSKTEFRNFAATLDSLGIIREFIASSCESVGLDKNKTYKLCLAVDEIATNIINYGYAESENSDGAIVVHIIYDKNTLTVILEDTAPPFNPLEKKIPGEKELSLPLEERPIGGLGIMLAKENVDEFRYNFENGTNRNIFCVNLK